MADEITEVTPTAPEVAHEVAAPDAAPDTAATVAEHGAEYRSDQTTIAEYLESLLVTVILALFGTSFVVQAFVALVAMAVLSGIDAPKPAPADLHGGRPLLEIVRQPRFIAAALCGIIAYPMMNLVMTSAPLAMKMCGLSVSDSNFGIQWHIVAMYGPSFFTGSLIARFGARRIVAAGLLLEAAAATIGLSGITALHFWATLIVLGIGWNFAFVGASALVLETHRPQERNKVQAFNDFLVFGMMAVGSFSSGQLLANYGWSAVNLVVFPPIFLGLAVLMLASFARRRRLQAVDQIPDPSI